jgi:hypothetical protein
LKRCQDIVERGELSWIRRWGRPFNFSFHITLLSKN